MGGSGPSTEDGADQAGLEKLTERRPLLNVLDAVKKAGAGFPSLKDTRADTTTPHGQLMLTIHGGLAEFERRLIRARTGEGRECAKARGVHFGRPTIGDERPIRTAVLRAAIQGTARAGIVQELRTLPNLTLLHAGHFAVNRRWIIVIAVSLADPLQRPNCRWFCLLLQG
jgi:DNA invertase Pin-like site-specific DNA recombinase